MLLKLMNGNNQYQGKVESVTSVKPNLKATETIAIIDSMIEVVE